MNEFDVIATYFHCEQLKSDDLLVPNGDDCAVIATHSERPLAISVDTCVSGVHFPKNSAAKWVAKRALRTALSDLAAMGATPKWVTMALTLPTVDPKWLNAFSKSLFKDLAHFGCELIGGDTTQGDTLSVSFTVIGECPQPLTRSGAQQGDNIYVTGTLGNGAAALYYLQHQLDAHLYSDEDKSVLKQREKFAKKHFYKPRLPFDVAQAIAACATAAIDISDGLLADLSHICTQSDVQAQVDVTTLPLAKTTQQLAKQKADNLLLGLPQWLEDDISDKQKVALTWALSGGDDYQLCFTASQAEFERLAQDIKLQCTKIGTIQTQVPHAEKACDVQLIINTQPLTLSHVGYKHFAKKT